MVQVDEKNSKRPNIIYILGDDHRGNIMKNMGHPIVETPNLDKLGKLKKGSQRPDTLIDKE